MSAHRVRVAVLQVVALVGAALVMCQSASAGGRLYVSNAITDALVVMDVDTKATLETMRSARIPRASR